MREHLVTSELKSAGVNQTSCSLVLSDAGLAAF